MADSQHRVGITIAADEDLEAVQKAKTELNEFSKSGIIGIERLEDKVVSLQRFTINLRKEIELNRKAQAELAAAEEQGTVSKEQAAQMTRQLTEREKELTAAMQRASFSQRTAQQDLKNLNLAQREAAQNAQLLAAQFGVNLPNQLTTFATRIPAVQFALGKAFNVGLIGAFAAAAGRGLAEVVVALLNYEDTLQRVKRAAADVFDPVGAAARDLKNENRAAQNASIAERVIGSQNRQRELGRQLGIVGEQDEYRLIDIQTRNAVEDLKRTGNLPPLVEAQEISRIRALAEARKAEQRRKDALQSSIGRGTFRAEQAQRADLVIGLGDKMMGTFSGVEHGPFPEGLIRGTRASEGETDKEIRQIGNANLNTAS